MKKSSRSIVRAAPDVFSVPGRSLEGVIVLSVAVGLMVSVGISRELGPAARGLYSAIAVWSQFLGWIAVFSVDKAVAVLPERQPRAELAALNAAALNFVRGNSAIWSGVGAAVVWVLFADWKLSLITAASVAAIASMELKSGFKLGRGDKKRYLAIRLVAPLVIAVVAGAGLALGGSDSRKLLIVASSLPLSALAASLTGGLLKFERLARRRDYLRILGFASFVQLGYFLRYLTSRLDLLILPFLFGAKGTGIYVVAIGPSQVLIHMGSAGIVRGVAARGRSADRMAALLALGFSVAFGWSAGWVIPFIFGEEFTQAVPLSRILIAGAWFSFVTQMYEGSLLGEGHVGFLSLVNGAGTCVFALGIWMYPSLIGVATASSVSYLVALLVALVLTRVVRRRTGWRIDAKPNDAKDLGFL